jgi:hypothetical protein
MTVVGTLLPRAKRCHVRSLAEGDIGALADRSGFGSKAVIGQRGMHATWKRFNSYFVTMRRGADGVVAAGEIENVTHVFQPIPCSPLD